MPEISRFFGVVVSMYYNDHAPPHFHVRYGKKKALIALDPLAVLEGAISPRVLGLVMEWGSLHGAELVENWERARRQESLKRIPPLE